MVQTVPLTLLQQRTLQSENKSFWGFEKKKEKKEKKRNLVHPSNEAYVRRCCVGCLSISNPQRILGFLSFPRTSQPMRIRIRKVLILAALAVVISSASAAKNKNKNKKPVKVVERDTCSDRNVRGCKKARECFWNKGGQAGCSMKSSISCDDAGTSKTCRKVGGCFWDRKGKDCVEMTDATCAMALKAKDCRKFGKRKMCSWDKDAGFRGECSAGQVLAQEEVSNDCEGDCSCETDPRRNRKDSCNKWDNCEWTKRGNGNQAKKCWTKQ